MRARDVGGCAPESEGHVGAVIAANEGHAAGGHASSAPVNDAHRRIALGFLESRPLGVLVTLRNILAPLQKLQREQCYVGSEVWEREQNLVEARRMSSAGENPLPMRSYPILEAAEGNMELNCLRRLRQLQSEPDLWSVVLPCDRTAGNVSNAFKMVSRAGVLVHGDLEVPHTRYPFRLFLACKHPQLEAHLQSDPVCMRCPWTAKFLEKKTNWAQSRLGRCCSWWRACFT